MAIAYITQGETLTIGGTEIKKVKQSPELGSAPNKIDATNFASEMMQYVPGLPDHSGELTWTANAMTYTETDSNVAYLASLSADTEYAIVVTKPTVGVTISFTGFVSWAFSAASVNGLQEITITVTPTSGYTYAAYSA